MTVVDFDSVKNKAEELKDKAEDYAGEHKEQVEGGIDKAADFVGTKLGHEDKVDQAAEKLKGFLPDK